MQTKYDTIIFTIRNINYIKLHMSNLLVEFTHFRDKTGIPITKISEHTGIDVQKLYRFSSDNGDLRNDDAVKLYKYLQQQTIKS